MMAVPFVDILLLLQFASDVSAKTAVPIAVIPVVIALVIGGVSEFIPLKPGRSDFPLLAFFFVTIFTLLGYVESGYLARNDLQVYQNASFACIAGAVAFAVARGVTSMLDKERDEPGKLSDWSFGWDKVGRFLSFFVLIIAVAGIIGHFYPSVLQDLLDKQEPAVIITIREAVSVANVLHLSAINGIGFLIVTATALAGTFMSSSICVIHT